MNQEIQQRIEAFFNESQVDSLLLRNASSFPDSNFQYFSGTRIKDSFLILKRKAKPLIVSSVLEAGNIASSNGLQVMPFNSEKELLSLLRKKLGKRIGLNFTTYPVKNFENLRKTLKGRKFLDVSETFAKLRSVKSLEEIRKIREACRISEMAVDYFENFFRQSITEIEVAEKLKDFFKRMNCASAFEPIVAFRENSCIPHHENSRRRIENNGFLLLDFGAKFEGYCSDISRTFYIGNPSLEMQNTYRSVLEAKKLAESLLVPKAKAKKIALEVDAFLKQRLKQGMIHALGHGIGLEEHDFPSGFSTHSELVIEENQCFAIEPAFYGKDFGIRIEDNCCISAQGVKMLSAAPKELISL